MKRARKLRRLVPIGLVLLACATRAEEGRRVYRGQYHWVEGVDGDVTVYFEPTDEPGEWEVEFHFTYGGQHVYSGTARGGLDRGKLTGQVLDDGGEQAYVFRGSWSEGRFAGTHALVTGSAESETGTLTLR